MIHDNSGGCSREATGAAASNLDLYQVNCSFYDALGRDDAAYLIARAVQVLPARRAPGVLRRPAGRQQRHGPAPAQRVGRDINATASAAAEIEADLRKPVVQALLRLIRLRNRHPAFGGRFTLAPGPDHALAMRWALGDQAIGLDVDLRARQASITCAGPDRAETWALTTPAPSA